MIFLKANRCGFTTEIFGNKFLYRNKKNEQSKKEAKKLNLKIIKKILTLDEILNKLDDKCIPVILVNWRQLVHLMKEVKHRKGDISLSMGLKLFIFENTLLLQILFVVRILTYRIVFAKKKNSQMCFSVRCNLNEMFFSFVCV